MVKPPLKNSKCSDQLRLVFLTVFVFYVSLLLLENYFSVTGHHGVTFSIFNMQNDATRKVVVYTNQNNVTSEALDKPNCITENFTENNNVEELVKESPTRNLDPCSGKYIYVHDLPKRFNEDLLKNCHTLSKWTNMCPYVSNLGLGPKVIIDKSKRRVLSEKSWYATNQFTLEIIFHNTMKHYKCLTNDSSLASAVYVPYYAGLDVGQYLWGFNVSVRDSSPKELVKWLGKQPQWKKLWGRDHFFVGGRIGNDFRRKTEEYDDWGSKLMFLPEAKNMSILPIESGGPYGNDFPIPYPTYFHPSKDVEIFQWQEKMRKVKRPYLFTFAGAPRPNSTTSIRNELIKQCQSSRSCKFHYCYGHKDNRNHCDDPVQVMKVFQSSVFCLQPPGDSYTRRSIFDSILAGCVPVFFHPESAYNQYLWHFPRNGSSYSIYIPESDVKKVVLNETLSRVPASEVLAMKEEVIRLIPRIIYSNPRSRLEAFEDAFDIAVKGILGRIEAIRREVNTNVENFSGLGFVNMNNTNSSSA